MLSDMDTVMERIIRFLRKSAFYTYIMYIRENKGASSLFSLHRQNKPSASYIQNFKPLTIFCGCTARLVFELIGNHRVGVSCDVAQIHWAIINWATSWENRHFAYAKTTAKLISAFVFATRIVQSLYFLKTKLQASSHIVFHPTWHPLLCGRTVRFVWDPVGDPKDRFSHNVVQLYLCHT